ncbi:MAG: acyl-phosphate glycerol 3-phosphate acyltransferase [Candidatus Saccharibacteria bacterium]|nr:acyl-phosphate glycerol 3-phosphate acyltransferase [Candidatus Saccharibacteria bacterium]
MLYHVFRLLLVAPIVWWIYRVTVSGKKNLPKKGGFILAANHLAKSDSAIIVSIFRRKIIFGAKKEYFVGRGIAGQFVKWFFRSSDQIPVDRTGRGAVAFINDAVSAVKQRKIVGLHVEGTRSPDGRLYKARVGVAKIAKASHVPIVPIAIIGTDVAKPAGRRKKVRIIIGKAIHHDEYKDLSPNQIAALVTQRIHQLSGQELVDDYAPIPVPKDLH